MISKGTWVNEAGSRLTISSIENNSILGYYNTALGNPDAEESFPIQGKCTDELFSFTAYFSGYDSICVWNGYFDKKADKIELHWLLSSTDSEIPMSLKTGKSFFIQENIKEKKA